jgi:large subunit ribosomal protein L35
MPKLKTKSAARKRFKVTSGGKVLVGGAHKRHNMRKRSAKQNRQARGTKQMSPGHAAKIIKQWLAG